MYGEYMTYYEFGDPKDVLQLRTRRVRLPQNDELLVRMLARPINPSDLIPIKGSYAHRIALPAIPGYEGVGIVEEVGSLVSPSLIGQRVLPLRGEGTWQAYVKSPASFAVCIPDTIEDLTAAQMYINPLTAWIICTEVLKLKVGDVLVVNACGSAIGHIFAQLSKIIGFELIAVTRSRKYTKDLLACGASYVIDTSEHSLRETVMEVTDGRGADAAIDSIGGKDGDELAFCVQPGKTFVSIGLLSGVQVQWVDIVQKANVHATLFHLRHWNRKVTIEEWQRTFHQLIQLVVDKKLSLMPVSSTFCLRNIRNALKYLERTQTKGKVFLTD